MTLTELQQRIEEGYGARDSGRGVHHSFLWFAEEVGELASALAAGDQAGAEEEFADVLMWLVTLANMSGVDLSDAAEAWFANPSKAPAK